MKKKLVLLLVSYVVFCFCIYQNNNIKSTTIKTDNIERVTNTASIKTNEINTKETNNNSDSLAILSIKKINLKEKIYPLNDKRNNVEEHVTILNDSNLTNDSLIILAAHSGYGKLAYFNRLDELRTGDEIKLNINNETLTYILKKSEEQDKTGKIEIVKENTKQLILTTCSKNDKTKQLVIYCEKI